MDENNAITQHTPTPWEIWRTPDENAASWDDSHITYIRRTNPHPETLGYIGQAVCQICTWGRDYADDPEAQANAALIARAVNAHAELAAACNEIATWLISPDLSTETLENMRLMVVNALRKAV